MSTNASVLATGPTATPPVGYPDTGSVVPASELVELCAQDMELYGRTFFPSTFRQSTPAFHRHVYDKLESPLHRHVGMMIFRGGAKTSLLRIYTSKRIAYGISHTVLFVSETQEHSKKSIRWLKKAVEFNTNWATLFGLQRGAPWTDEQFTVYNKVLDISITVGAYGISGQIRGINIDDFRPDLIIVDDPCSEENTSTPEQRKKLSDLFFGALEKSLAPRSEAPDAKQVLLQTPLNQEDLISSCASDSQWSVDTYGCFDESGQSRWPERFPTEVLVEDKQAHIKRGQLALWLREMECSITSPETSLLRGAWLQYWDILPDNLVTFISIDPAPPPSERQQLSGLADKDYEVISVVGVCSRGYYLCEQSRSRGHDPEWTTNEFFRLVDKWKPLRGRVEGVAYQRTLKWILEKRMKELRRYLQINCPSGGTAKRHRILQAFSGIGSQGRFFVHRSMMDFQSQFISYPNVAHDDDLDSAAMAIEEALDYPVEFVSSATGEPAVGSFDQKKWRQAP